MAIERNPGENDEIREGRSGQEVASGATALRQLGIARKWMSGLG
jgi:hypothetical protein